ncbi:unnamed protein product [Prorocentrum cordatum]|uniref:Uncharacterized protein n=1 Tax=Prorocentrum cordatum TaxID=2364126 RepID=A0ABN9US99_9DINO|nr:unnamed protein product [Polarella glacialis]
MALGRSPGRPPGQPAQTHGDGGGADSDDVSSSSSSSSSCGSSCSRESRPPSRSGTSGSRGQGTARTLTGGLDDGVARELSGFLFGSGPETWCPALGTRGGAWLASAPRRRLALLPARGASRPPRRCSLSRARAQRTPGLSHR